MNAPLDHPLRVATPLNALLKSEGAILAAGSAIELCHVTLAEAAKLIPGGLCAWVDRRGKLRATSTNGRADRNTPFAQWLEGELKREAGAKAPEKLTLRGSEAHTAFTYAVRIPMDGVGALAFLSENEMSEGGIAAASRLASLARVCARSHMRKGLRLPRRTSLFVAVATALIMAIPVRMSTLAPAEIVARAPYHVTAPYDGVIAAVHVAPFTTVATDDPLISLETTRLSSEAEIADREERLALARARKAELSAFYDPQAKADVAVARAQADLAGARKDYARTNLGRAELSAPQAGIAIIEDVESWAGRPVATGETILEIADLARLELRILAPLDGGEALEPGAEVRLFLDADPVTPVKAVLSRASFRASPQADGSMAFDARADFEESEGLRLGAKGVAKVYGEPAPLGWWLVRKPVTAFRQLTGL